MLSTHFARKHVIELFPIMLPIKKLIENLSLYEKLCENWRKEANKTNKEAGRFRA